MPYLFCLSQSSVSFHSHSCFHSMSCLLWFKNQHQYSWFSLRRSHCQVSCWFLMAKCHKSYHFQLFSLCFQRSTLCYLNQCYLWLVGLFHRKCIQLKHWIQYFLLCNCLAWILPKTLRLQTQFKLYSPLLIIHIGWLSCFLC